MEHEKVNFFAVRQATFIEYPFMGDNQQTHFYKTNSFAEFSITILKT